VTEVLFLLIGLAVGYYAGMYRGMLKAMDAADAAFDEIERKLDSEDMRKSQGY
jgi:hypothetical protein